MPSSRHRRCSPFTINLQLCLFLLSNVCTALVVFMCFYFSSHYTYTVEAVTSDKVGRQLLVDKNVIKIPPPKEEEEVVPPSQPHSTVVYLSFSSTDGLPLNSSADHHSTLLCRKHLRGSTTLPKQATVPVVHSHSTLSNKTSVNSHTNSSTLSNKTSVINSSTLSNMTSHTTLSNKTSVNSHTNSSTLSNKTSVKSHTTLSNKTLSVNSHPTLSNKTASPMLNHTSPLLKSNSTATYPRTATVASQSAELESSYKPFVIGITPTYYRMTQKLDLTSLCQTLMNVPRFLWIVVEDTTSSSSQVKEILSHCRVESILLHTLTTNQTKKAKQRGVDQRNLAMDWIRDRCRGCEGGGTCDGVVYFMDDDNTFDIRLFEKIRWTQSVSVFPVGFVAGLKFEGPVCKDGKVDKWQVQYAPKRHIPVDMAAFALNVKVLISHPTVRMGFKPDQKKRSTPGYLEPDFLKSVGASRDSVECRGAPDEILVWHVKSTYKSLIYEKKHPSDPKFKV